MPACGSTTVFMPMEVTHDSMQSTKSSASRAAPEIPAHRNGKTPSLLPRFPNRSLHVHSPRPTMTDPHHHLHHRYHCAALHTAVAAPTRPFSSSLILLPLSPRPGSLSHSPAPELISARRRSWVCVWGGGNPDGTTEDAVKQAGDPVLMLQPGHFPLK